MQLAALTKENKLLRETLQNQVKGVPAILQDGKSFDDRESLSSGLDSANPESAETSPAKATETPSEIYEVRFFFNYLQIIKLRHRTVFLTKITLVKKNTSKKKIVIFMIHEDVFIL